MRRLFLMASALSLLTCDAQANRPEITPAPAPEPPPPPVFHPEVVRLAPGSAADALAMLSTDPAGALRLAEAALGTAAADDAARLRWIAASAAISEEDPDKALALLAPLAESEHPLSRWARLRRAELTEARDPAAAAAMAAGLTGDWAGSDRARRVEARSLARSGQLEEAIPKLRALVEETADHIGAASAAMPLARILAEREDDVSREEALALYRRVASRAPLAAVGQEAERLAAEVLETLPPARRRALAEPTLADAMFRAEALYNANRHRDAEEAYAAIARRADGEEGTEVRCEALLMQGKAMLRRRERAAGSRHLIQVAGRCADPGIRAAARYNAGRALVQLGQRTEGIAQYDRLPEESPESNLADDALLRAALAARDEGDFEDMATRLSQVPTRYPQGDMRGEARFALAIFLFRRGDTEQARVVFEQSLADDPGETAEDIRGRTEYWHARLLASLGHEREAGEAFTALFREHPLSYYAQQALARLTELDRTAADALRESLRQDEDPPPLTFPWRDEMDDPSFLRAVELFRVGEVDLALNELEHLGATGEGADPDLLWLTAALLDRAGALPQASLLVRRRLKSVYRIMPTGRGAQLWRLAYPQAFSPLIEQVAMGEGVPAPFVRAVAREESAFDPGAVSVAHAYGLIQLIRPTAQRFARPLGLPSDPASLKRPEINLRIGTRYIAYLWERYADNPAVVPSAYNAGHAAVDRWLRERPEQSLDWWVEDIPYDETRRYTRRVLQTYGVYSWLDRGELPRLESRLRDG